MTALRGIDVRLRLARLFCVTDARVGSGDLSDFAGAIMGAGVDLVQLRDDRASDREKVAALEVLRTAALRSQGLVSVYADPDLAREFGADLLHLAKGRPDAEKARRYVHRWAKIGRSCYTTKDVDVALADPRIDFLTVGPTFAGLPLFGRPPGLDLVRHAAQAAPPSEKGAKPWFAIGGITLANVAQVTQAGARRVAVGRAISAADDPAAAATAFADHLRAAWGDAMEAFTLDAVAREGTFRPIADERSGSTNPRLILDDSADDNRSD